MKILMIGHSGSGKTSYMAGLYKLFGNRSNSWGLQMDDAKKGKKLKKMGYNITKGKYPNGTDIASQYNFWLTFDKKPLIPFEWYDYRGGALYENSKTSKDAQDLLHQIDVADAIIIFLDGAKIVNMTNDELENEYDTLIWSIHKSLAKHDSSSYCFPISFIITKADMYENYDILFESPGLEYFTPIIDKINDSSVACGMITAVMVGTKGIYNVFPPVVFSLFYGMHHYIDERIKSLNREVEQFKRYSPGFWDDLLSYIFGGKSDRELAIASLKKIEKEREQLSNLEKLGDSMNKYIETLDNERIINRF